MPATKPPVDHTLCLTRGRFAARPATGDADLQAAQRLRYLAFRATSDDDRGLDADQFDATCQHVLVEDVTTGTLIACFRLLCLAGGRELSQSYAAQFYGLDRLQAFPGPMVEIGRFCLHPDWTDPDILRVVWGALTAYVDAHGIEMLFGCSSFAGTDARPYTQALALLRDRHLAPRQWLPEVKAPSVFRYADALCDTPDLKLAQAVMPPLLRTYLMMGGWVSDHAVLDHDLNTMHVFTGLEIKAIPAARARLLRRVAG